MKTRDIKEGRSYRNTQGVIRQVVSMAEDPNHPGEAKYQTVSWRLVSHHRGIPSGVMPICKFAWWARDEVQGTVEGTQTPQETVLEAEAPVVAAPEVKMSENDMYAAFTVTLTRELKGKDLEATLTALQQIKGVASVIPIRANMQHFIAKDQARRELLTQIRDVLKDVK